MPPKKVSSAALRKAAPKKAASKKAAPKKAASKKAAPKKAASRKAASKKAASKKAAPALKSTAPQISKTPSEAAKTTYGQWYWTGDAGKLMQYDIKQNQVMEDAYRKVGGTGTVKMCFNNWNYQIDFTNMIQRNLDTNRVRVIKREVEKASEASIQKSKESASGRKHQRSVQKGNGVVDPLSGKGDDCHVFESNAEVYQCTLNQTDVHNNHNKFFVLQLLEADDASAYYLYTRWGRVGVDGQMLTEQFANLSAAMSAYKKKFRDKTCNDWDSRSTFTKVPGKYYLMQIDYTAKSDDDGDEIASDSSAGGSGAKPASKKAKTEAAKPSSSALPPAIQAVMKLIGSRETMTSAMKELSIDTKRMPLGKISKDQIKAAYGVLKKVESELAKANPHVDEATSLFYTLIPHDLGFRRPPLINTPQILQEKMDMLETLGQLEVAAKLLDSTDGGSGRQLQARHPLDAAYDAMQCNITSLSKTDPAFQRIVTYAKNTHGKTHTSYKLEVAEVFEIQRHGESSQYSKKYSKMPNKQMLWHGSRLTNYMGILSQGLRIAPPEAPMTGYMFGKGIYLADVCSKSANYCNTTRHNTTGLMLLCEAALGNSKAYTAAQYMEKAAVGFDSTMGVGTMRPNPKKAVMVDDVLWPMGPMTTEKVNSSLLYPEYVVYDVSQCRMRYLVKMNFVYK